MPGFKLIILRKLIVDNVKLISNRPNNHRIHLDICRYKPRCECIENSRIWLSNSGESDYKARLHGLRLPIFHTITATFTRLPLTFTRLLFPGDVRERAEKAKMPRWKLLRRGIRHSVIVWKKLKTPLIQGNFWAKGVKEKSLPNFDTLYHN